MGNVYELSNLPNCIYVYIFFFFQRLNEGFTVFVERKIIGRMHGENYRHFEALEGWKDLEYAVSITNHNL